MKLELADKLVEAAIKKAEEMKIPVCIAIADKSGHLQTFRRMKGSMLAGINVSIDKAYSSAATTFPTSELGKIAQPGELAYGLANSDRGRMVVYAGGLPVKEGKKTIGAIGVSGGLAPEDEKIAQAALEAIK